MTGAHSRAHRKFKVVSGKSSIVKVLWKVVQETYV